jgi:hypothetical protein
VLKLISRDIQATRMLSARRRRKFYLIHTAESWSAGGLRLVPRDCLFLKPVRLSTVFHYDNPNTVIR